MQILGFGASCRDPRGSACRWITTQHGRRGEPSRLLGLRPDSDSSLARGICSITAETIFRLA